jgi:nitroreductase
MARFLIVVGLPKAGTTFLYAQCAQRPDVFAMPLGNKEVDYFRRGRDLAEYQGLFAPGEDLVRVDASPLYIDDLERALANMRHALSGHEVRVVVCLRDPLERAYSHYLHDVAQNQKIVGHADYGFWSPTVMAKYLFPLAPRVARLQEVFGAENVFGFAFGADLCGFETMLREFAGLEDTWSLDLSSNPAPGFTSPQSYYNAEQDMEIPVEGALYRLPAGHLLVMNRQFSLYRQQIHRPLAEQIVLRQATITRSFDTGMLEQATRARIYGDMAEAAQRLGLDIAFDSGPRRLQSQPSDGLPPQILNQLKPVITLDAAVRKMFATGVQSTSRTIVDMPSAGPSLARDMAWMSLAQARDAAAKQSAHDLQRRVVHRFGPIPHYIESLMAWEVARGRYDRALTLFDGHGGAAALLWPMDLVHFLRSRGIELPPDVAAQFQRAGVRVAA